MSKTIENWAIIVKWSDGTEEEIADFPDGVANAVDEHLTELEEKLSEEEKGCPDGMEDTFLDTRRIK